ncbi:hypothetical protein ACS0PU_004062 [Formica fusca]
MDGALLGYYVREGYECGHEMTIMQRCWKAPQGIEGCEKFPMEYIGYVRCHLTITVDVSTEKDGCENLGEDLIQD